MKMFCPNCGANIETKQNYCRSCGLKLDSILRVITEQIPSKEYARLQRRKELFERLGFVSLSGFGLLGISLFLSEVVYYKILLFGASAMFWSGFIAFAAFGLLTVFFFNYPRLFMRKFKAEQLPASADMPEEKEISPPTKTFLPDGFVEPVSGVAENTTDFVLLKAKKNSGDL
jgi:hypothetical protein